MDNKIRVACIAVVFNDTQKILLIRRHKPDHATHDTWHCPGGGMEFGEQPKEAVLREVKEETGYTVRLLSQHPFVYTEMREDEQKQIIILAYPTHVGEGTIDTSDEGVSDARWFSYEEIDFTNTLPFTKETIDDALRTISS